MPLYTDQAPSPQALIDFPYRGFRPFIFQFRQGRRLRAVEQDEGPILFVRNGPIVVR